MKLRLLNKTREVLSEDFRSQEDPMPIEEPDFDYFGKGKEPNYGKIRKALLKHINKSTTDAKGDASLGRVLHKLLPLSRREASQGRFWAYLSTQIPEFIRWRYGSTYNRWGADWRRNTISWCWWWAELSADHSSKRDGRRYRRTKDGAYSRHHLWSIDTPASSAEKLRHAIIDEQPDKNRMDYSESVWMKSRVRMSTVLFTAFEEQIQTKASLEWIDEFREDL